MRIKRLISFVATWQTLGAVTILAADAPIPPVPSPAQSGPDSIQPASASAVVTQVVSSAKAPPAALAKPAGRPLTADEQKRFEAGRTMFEATCLACHQQNGLGQPNLAPPLVGSEWVAGSPKRLVRIVLHGLRGPIKVKGETYELEMPALGVLDDEQIAAALTYVRREWGHAFDPVDPAFVAKVREETASREDAWTQPDLLRIQP